MTFEDKLNEKLAKIDEVNKKMRAILADLKYTNNEGPAWRDLLGEHARLAHQIFALKQAWDA